MITFNPPPKKKYIYNQVNKHWYPRGINKLDRICGLTFLVGTKHLFNCRIGFGRKQGLSLLSVSSQKLPGSYIDLPLVTHTLGESVPSPWSALHIHRNISLGISPITCPATKYAVCNWTIRNWIPSVNPVNNERIRQPYSGHAQHSHA